MITGLFGTYERNIRFQSMIKLEPLLVYEAIFLQNYMLCYDSKPDLNDHKKKNLEKNVNENI